MAAPNPVKKVPIHLQSSQNRLLIKNGKIINASGTKDEDVYIEEGVIKQLGKNLIIPGGTRIIDARGLYVMPGGIDAQTQFESNIMGMTSVDDYYKGTRAAIAGGTTMIIDFAIPKKNESLIEVFNNTRLKADEKVCCDYSLHVGITSWNEEVQKEMETLCLKFGVNSFKVFMAPTDHMISDSELYNVFAVCKDIGSIAMVHAENGEIISENTKRLLSMGLNQPYNHELSRPDDVEAEAVNRACVIANQIKSPIYFDSVSSKKAADTVVNYREGNERRVFGSTTAASIGLDVEASSPSTITSPPIRSDASLYLIQLLSNGDLQVVSSDNCTFSTEQKNVGKDDFTKIPNGVNGVEDRMSVTWEKGVESGAMSPSQFVAITSSNAAKIFNLYPKKGLIAVGSDADIVLWNPKKAKTISAKTHHQACDTNIFEGMTVHGVPEYVIVSGRVCVDEGDLKAVEGFGRFIPMQHHAPFIFGTAEEMEKQENGEFHGCNIDNLDQYNHKSRYDDDAGSPKGSVFGDTNDSHGRTGKGMRPEGQRNLQDSTFSISGELEDTARRSCIRVRNPPGGKSSGGFW